MRQDVAIPGQTVMALIIAVVLAITASLLGAYRGWSQGGLLMAVGGLVGGFIFGAMIAGIAYAIWEGRAAIVRALVALHGGFVLLFLRLIA